MKLSLAAFLLSCFVAVLASPVRRGVVTDVVITIGKKLLTDAVLSAFGKKEKVTITPGASEGAPVDCEVEWKWRISKWELVYDATAECPGATSSSGGRSSKGSAVVNAVCDVTRKLFGSGVFVQYGDKSCTT